ncbi:hypothetical protein ACFYPG_06365 [Micromonospora sp. NPDC005553]
MGGGHLGAYLTTGVSPIDDHLLVDCPVVMADSEGNEFCVAAVSA